MASFKLKVDYAGDNNEPVHDCAIFDNSHECNAAAEQLIRMPTDKSHADNENDVTFCNVIDNLKNYTRVTNSSKTGVNQCNNSLRYRNRVDCDNFFVNSDHKNSSNSFNQSQEGLPQICGSTFDNSIETENTNISNSLLDIDVELYYNDIFCMPSDYYYDHSSINNLLCSKNIFNYLFMIHFNVKSLQKILTNYLTTLLIKT